VLLIGLIKSSGSLTNITYYVIIETYKENSMTYLEAVSSVLNEDLREREVASVSESAYSAASW